MSGLRILFAGTPEFAATHLKALTELDHLDIAAVYTQPDRRSGRGKKLQSSPVKIVAEANHLPVEQPSSLKNKDTQAQLTSYGADLLVVVAYGLLLPLPVLQTPRFGCINVHGSLLPRWRGAAPVERAIEAGDCETGITIMKMDVGLDTGNMLLKRSIAILPVDTGDSLRQRLATVGVEALIDCLALFNQKTLTPPPSGEVQDEALATYASKLGKEEALLDWQLEANTLERKIRAYHSSNVIYTWLDNQRVRVWLAQAVQMPTVQRDQQVANFPLTNPGVILKVSSAGILVACGKGALLLTQLQLPGAKALPAAQLLNAKGQLFQPGFHFSHACTQT